MNRIILENSVSKERKLVLRTATFRKPWRVVGLEPSPKPPAPHNNPTPNDPALPDLVTVERARAKFGRNTSLAALAMLVKTRGL